MSLVPCRTHADCESFGDALVASYCDSKSFSCRLRAREHDLEPIIKPDAHAAAAVGQQQPQPEQQQQQQQHHLIGRGVEEAEQVGRAANTTVYVPAPLVNPEIKAGDWVAAAFGWFILLLIILGLLACTVWYFVVLFLNRGNRVSEEDA